MPALIEVIHPDQSISFVEISRRGEPHYISLDELGNLTCSVDDARDPIAMLIEDETGVLALQVFELGRVIVAGQVLADSQSIDTWSEIEIDGHVLVVMSTGATSEGRAPAGRTAQALEAASQGVQNVQVVSVRQKEVRGHSMVYNVKVQTSGDEQSAEPEVALSAEAGWLGMGFTPLLPEQRRLISLVFNPERFNARAVDLVDVELIVRSEPSWLLRAGAYRIQVLARLTRSPDVLDTNTETPLDIPPFEKFRLGDPIPTTHGPTRMLLGSWAAFVRAKLGWPLTEQKRILTSKPRYAAASLLAVTNEGNTDTEFIFASNNAPGSDCAVDFVLLPRKGAPTPKFLTYAPDLFALADTSALETSPQTQELKDLVIHPGETREVIAWLQPRNPPRFALRQPRQQIDVVVSSPGATPQKRSITWALAPTILGPKRLLLCVLVLLALIASHVARMNERTVIGKASAGVCPTPAPQPFVLEQGETFDLSICGEPFSDLKLEKLAFNATPEVIAFTGQTMTLPIAPQNSATYRLTAVHPLGRLFPWPPFVAQRALEIKLSKVDMPTGTWGVEPSEVLPNGEVTVYWDKVDRASRLVLYENSIPHVIPRESILTGQMKFNPTQPVSFTLWASNDYTSTYLGGVSISVAVTAPVMTPMPLPPPTITRFDVGPTEVMSGQRVLLQWDVTGPADALTVTLVMDGIAAIVPANGLIYQQPMSDRDAIRAYELIADNGKTFVRESKYVTILSPTPTPTPTPVPSPTAGPAGTPNYDAFCGGPDRSHLVQGTFRWVCLDNPKVDITDEACKKLLNLDTAVGKADSPGDKGSWRCWNRP